MKIKLEDMESIKIDIGRELVIQRYRDSLLIMNIDEGHSQEIKNGDLGETMPKDD